SLGPAEGAELAVLAAAAVAARLSGQQGDRHPPGTVALRACAASFVTLEAAGTFRGCIGTPEPARPLLLRVFPKAGPALTAPRLPPVTVADWPKLDVTVSVLSASQALPAPDLAALLAQLRPGIDGLLLTDGVRRATFLPAVWAKVPDPDDFVAALLRKGGWSSHQWPAQLSARRYTADEFHDPGPREPLAEPRPEPEG